MEIPKKISIEGEKNIEIKQKLNEVVSYLEWLNPPVNPYEKQVPIIEPPVYDDDYDGYKPMGDGEKVWLNPNGMTLTIKDLPNSVLEKWLNNKKDNE